MSSPATLVADLAPAHHAITRAMAEVQISGPVYGALMAASDALHRVAAEVGQAGALVGRAPAR